MRFFVAGVNYRTAPVGFREKVAVPAGELFSVGWRLLDQARLSEVVILSTCSRVELYGVAPDGAGDLSRLFDLVAPAAGPVTSHVYVHEGSAAIDHLIRVTSGLDSMVLGETDVQHQVKDAYDTAHRAGLTGKILNFVFQKALQATKEIRNNTTIGVGTTSIGSVAVTLARKILGDRFSRSTVLLIGAGGMASTCLRHFVKSGVTSFIICNRSPERALRLTDEFGGRTVPLEDLHDVLPTADIVVSATGAPGFIVDSRSVAAARAIRGRRPLFLIDIAVPRDIDPALKHVDGVFLYNVDDLEAVVEGNLRNREAELHACAGIIKERVGRILHRLQTMEEFRIENPEPRRTLCQEYLLRRFMVAPDSRG
jgi:glutamyl-tRNA reductase